jgi:hypothetical protein
MMKHVIWLALGTAACFRNNEAVTPDAPVVANDDLYLTVKNVGGHCSVSVNDEQAFTMSEQSLADFVPGQVIPLTATPAIEFTLGLWHHTTNDHGSGDPGTIDGGESSATVTLGDEPGCVWICCSSGSGECPTTDQCP